MCKAESGVKLSLRSVKWSLRAQVDFFLLLVLSVGDEEEDEYLERIQSASAKDFWWRMAMSSGSDSFW